MTTPNKDRKPVCSRDVCELCGDCLYCSGESICWKATNPKEGHTWPSRFRLDPDKRNNRKVLLQTLRNLASEDKGPNPDGERIHSAVDDALVQYIGVYEVEELIRNMTTWGA